jgi:predicted outer membrane repeat protein
MTSVYSLNFIPECEKQSQRVTVSTGPGLATVPYDCGPHRTERSQSYSHSLSHCQKKLLFMFSTLWLSCMLPFMYGANAEFAPTIPQPSFAQSIEVAESASFAPPIAPSATVWHVASDQYRSNPITSGNETHPFHSIQQAVNASSNGDVVVLQSGTHTLTSDWQGDPSSDLAARGQTEFYASKIVAKSLLLISSGFFDTNTKQVLPEMRLSRPWSGAQPNAAILTCNATSPVTCSAFEFQSGSNVTLVGVVLLDIGVARGVIRSDGASQVILQDVGLRHGSANGFTMVGASASVVIHRSFCDGVRRPYASFTISNVACANFGNSVHANLSWSEFLGSYGDRHSVVDFTNVDFDEAALVRITHCKFHNHTGVAAALDLTYNVRALVADSQFSLCIDIGNSEGSALIARGEAIVAMERCTFSHNSNLIAGGAIAQMARYMSIRNCTFDSNQATFGGAIFVGSMFGGSFPQFISRRQIFIVDSTFVHNSAVQVGGDIMSHEFTQILTSEVTMQSVTFHNSSAKAGAVVWMSGYGRLTGSAIQVQNAYSFGGNVERSPKRATFYSPLVDVSGAFYAGDACSMDLEFVNMTGTASPTTSGGLLVSADSSIVRLSDTQLSNTDSALTAGCVLVHNAAVFNCTRCKFRYCSASSSAGAVHFTDQSAGHFELCLFEYNTARRAGALVVSDTSYVWIRSSILRYHTAQSAGTVLVLDDATVDISHTQFLYNAVDGTESLSIGEPQGAAAIQVVNNAASTFAHLTVFNCSFVANHAVQSFGGAIVMVGAKADFSLCRFDSNTATYGGGAIATVNSPVSFDSCVFYNNSAGRTLSGTQVAGTSSPIAGGAVLSLAIDTSASSSDDNSIGADSTLITMDNCMCIFNEAVHRGGCIAAEEGSVLRLNGCHLSNNSASHGGAIHFRSQTRATIHHSNFSFNSASLSKDISALSTVAAAQFREFVFRRGGGIYVEAASRVDVHRCRFQHNFASGGIGGAIYTLQDLMLAQRYWHTPLGRSHPNFTEFINVTHSSFTHNVAEAGGVLFVDNVKHEFVSRYRYELEPNVFSPRMHNFAPYRVDLDLDRNRAKYGPTGAGRPAELFYNPSFASQNVQPVAPGGSIAANNTSNFISPSETAYIHGILVDAFSNIVNWLESNFDLAITVAPGDSVLLSTTSVPVAVDAQVRIPPITILAYPGTYSLQLATFASDYQSLSMPPPQDIFITECPVGQAVVQSQLDAPVCRSCGSQYNLVGGSECRSCPRNAICSAGSAAAQPGFYLFADSNSVAYTSWCVPGYCLGNNVCAPNTYGDLCAKCAPGYIHWRASCIACSEVHGGLLFVAILFNTAFLLTMAFLLRGRKYVVSIGVMFGQLMGLLWREVFFSPTTVFGRIQTFIFSIVLLEPGMVTDVCTGPWDVYQRVLYTWISAMCMVACLVLLYLAEVWWKNQARLRQSRAEYQRKAAGGGATSMALSSSAPASASIVAGLDTVNLESSNQLADAEVEHAEEMQAFGVAKPTLPTVQHSVLNPNVSVHDLPQMQLRKWDSIVNLGSSNSTQERFFVARASLSRFLFLPVITACLQIFQCRETYVGSGVFVLVSSPSLHCSSERWVSYAVIAILVAIGTLCWMGRICYMILVRMREDETVRRSYSAFVQPFVSNAWFWAVLLEFRKLLFAIVVMFASIRVESFHPSYTAFASSCLVASLLLLHVFVQPFRSRIDQIAESVCLSILTANSLMLASTTADSSLTQTLVVAFSAIVCSSFIVFFILRLLVVKTPAAIRRISAAASWPNENS